MLWGRRWNKRYIRSETNREVRFLSCFEAFSLPNENMQRKRANTPC